MMLFRNVLSGETRTHIEFVTFVWEEAERQFNDCHDDENWCDLTKEEQLAIYCDQFEHQLDGDWTMITKERSKEKAGFDTVSDEQLLRRLDEIEGQLRDFHISAYKSDLLYQERDEIKEELNKRSCEEDLTR